MSNIVAQQHQSSTHFAHHYASPFAAKSTAIKSTNSVTKNVAAVSTSQTYNFADYQSPFPTASSDQTAEQFTGKIVAFDSILSVLDQQMTAQPDVQSTTTDAFSKDALSKSAQSYDIFDIIDIINPLQHIPVVSNIYRAITGDEIRQEIRMTGNMVFGALTGPVGIASAVANSAVDYATGKPVGDHVLAAVAPDLERTIRDDYSIAGYLRNPFADGDNHVASSDTARRETMSAFSSQDADGIHVVTAEMIGQKIREAQLGTNRNILTVADLEATSGIDPDVVVQSTIAPTTQIDTANVRDMAQSITRDPNTVVQISPEAAQQLSQLAHSSVQTQTASPLVNSDTTPAQNTSNALTRNPLAFLNDNSAQQLRTVAAKNRQLGLALNSSATINQLMVDVQDDQIAQQVGRQVAALYQNNSEIIPTAQAQLAAPMGLRSAAILPSSTLSPAAAATTPAPTGNSITTITPTSAQRLAQQESVRTITPQELGTHYHGADDVANLSVAQAMQRALDKYRSLKR